MFSLGRIIPAVIFLAAPVWAQTLISARAGLVNFAEGDVFVEERRQKFPVDVLSIIKVGENLGTGSGWVEIQLGPGAYLRMGPGGLLRMENSDLTNMQCQIIRGSVMVEIFDKVDDNRIRIHFRDASIELKKEGVYRLDSGLSRLRVYGGKAEILQSQKKTTVKKGKAAVLGDTKAFKFDTEDKDTLHEWAARRSFTLYILNPLYLRWRLNHWTHLPGGWMKNKYYDVHAYSSVLEGDLNLRQWRIKMNLNMLNSDFYSGVPSRE